MGYFDSILKFKSIKFSSKKYQKFKIGRYFILLKLRINDVFYVLLNTDQYFLKFFFSNQILSISFSLKLNLILLWLGLHVFFFSSSLINWPNFDDYNSDI